MDGIHAHFTVRTSCSLLLLVLLQVSTEAQTICSAVSPVTFAENNNVGDVVQTITVQPGVTLHFSPPPANENNPFRLEGNQLIAAIVLDYETDTNHVAQITCTETGTELTRTISIVVLVSNENDNPPVFSHNPYYVDVNEWSPVDTVVGRFAATDLDQPNLLYYTLTSVSNQFKLVSPTDPAVLVNARLDYDTVKNVQLVLTAQDTPLTPADGRVSHTATTTIIVAILDVDNRPPWFQPCTKHVIDGAVVCQSAGYTGRVDLNEQEAGALLLKPGPLHAIDGDSGINEEITYRFLSGNDDLLFSINPDSGDITMLKPADVLGTISLTVLAAQKRNSYQFTTTTVTISVQVKSLHPPQFQKPQYDGFVSSMGAMVMDLNDVNVPLRILATDEDYAGAGGINPHITYSIDGSTDFAIIDGYLFMTSDLPEATLSLQVSAKDTSNGESATSQLSVEVKPDLTTSSLPPSTTDIMTTTSVGESTTDNSVSSTTPSTTSESTDSTSMSTDGSFPTTNPSLTTEETSTGSTAQPVTVPTGVFRVEDMAALGATLGVLLFVCLVVIGVLVYRMQKGKTAWKKIYEASMFRSALGHDSGGKKEGIQYTNEAFHNDEDGSSMGSGGPDGRSVMADGEPRKAAWGIPPKEAMVRSSAPLHALLPDDTSEMDSDKVDSEKEVKPILTKERRVEEGYKSVWFKEDIDPNAKEEVVIIPDSREDNSEDEDEEPSRSNKTPKVFFADADLDSGLGVKMGDPAEDSDSDEALTVDL